VSGVAFQTTGVRVERGMVLLIHEPATDCLPERFRLWTVSRVSARAKGVNVTLLGWEPHCLAEATATFPDGLVAAPWQVFALSQGDLRHVYNAPGFGAGGKTET
jgi:hypothetical protein